MQRKFHKRGRNNGKNVKNKRNKMECMNTAVQIQLRGQVKSLEKIIDDRKAENQLISDYFNEMISYEKLLLKFI